MLVVTKLISNSEAIWGDKLLAITLIIEDQVPKYLHHVACVLSVNCVYAVGHYVPATAQVIVESNSVHAKNLKGIGIGNGWVDPKIQYRAYSEVRIYTHPWKNSSI